MKRISIILCAILTLSIVSCKEETPEKPKVSYEAEAKSAKETPVADTARIEVADLPIHIPGTNFLIHPVGDLSVAAGRPRYDASASAAGSPGFQISIYDEGEITGYLRNLKFQQIGQDSLSVLADKPVLIQTATYLRSVADKTKAQLMVYTLADADTNKDGKLDVSDIRSLYLSDMGGARFTKLSEDMQELIDWNLVESLSRLYFRTIEDTNKNGEFDKTDVVHYHYLDLTGKEWTVRDYQPVK